MFLGGPRRAYQRGPVISDRSERGTRIKVKEPQGKIVRVPSFNLVGIEALMGGSPSNSA